MFTAVDGAYCEDLSGNRLWSVKLPTKDGWTRITAPSATTNTSDETQRALGLMVWSLPLSPGRLKSRYRELAKAYHPDLNPADPTAGAKMRALGHGSFDRCRRLRKYLLTLKPLLSGFCTGMTSMLKVGAPRFRSAWSSASCSQPTGFMRRASLRPRMPSILRAIRARCSPSMRPSSECASRTSGRCPARSSTPATTCSF